MVYELFKKSMIEENKSIFDKINKTNLHAHALLSANKELFYKEFNRKLEERNLFADMADFRQYTIDNLGDLISERDTQLKLYELSILTAVKDGIKVFDISVDFRSVYKIFNDSITNYVNALNKLKNKYKDKMVINFDLGISRKSYQAKDYYLIKKLIKTGVFNGIDLLGDELSQNIRCFKKVYRYAKKNNLILKAHVGEFGGAKSIKKAIKVLKLDVVQHGITVVDDKNIMHYAKKNKIVFNVCISSNLRFNNAINIKNHPIREMFDYGLIVTLNTDDELIFGSSLFNEYLLLYKNNVFNIEELYEIIKSGLNAVKD